ncbi:coatomer subunit beta' [Nematocida sp. AWRm77]|nr:coatomer subunit beta' [Nematocida sp. AWRm77]
MESRVSGRFEKARAKHVAVHRKSPLALVCIYNGDFELWNTTSMGKVKGGSIGEIPIRAGEFIEEREWLALGSDDGVLRVYCVDTLELKCKVQAHKDFIRSVVVHPSLPYIATSSDDTTVKIWDYSKDLAPVRTLEGHTHFVMCAEFSCRDNRVLVSCSMDHDVRVWNIETGKTVAVLKGEKNGGLNTVAYATDKYIVSGGDDGNIHVWDSAAETLVTSVAAHTGPVTSIRTTPRGFITAGEDGMVREWDKKRFRPESSVPAKLHRVWSAAQTSAGAIVVGGDDGISFVRKAQNEVLCSFKASGEDARIVLAEDTTLKQVKSTNLVSPPKVITTLSYVPDRIELSDTGRYLAVESDEMVHVYTLLGFLHQVSVPGHSVVWTGAEDFLVVYGKDIVGYADFEVEGKVPFRGEGKVCGLQKVDADAVLVHTEEKMSYVVGTDGSVLLSTKKVQGVHRYKNVFVLVHSDRVEMVQGSRKAECELKITSWCAKENVVFVHTNEKIVYFVVPEGDLSPSIVPVSVDRLSSNGVLIGATDVVWSVEGGKVGKYPIQWKLVEFQRQVLSGKVPKDIPEEHEKECIHFLMGMGMLEEAYSLTKDTDEKFELLLKLGKLTEAMDVADSESKFSKLCRLFVQQGDMRSALACSKKGVSVEDEILLSALCEDAANIRAASQKAYEQGKLLISLAAACRVENFDLCRSILEGTPFEQAFAKAHPER